MKIKKSYTEAITLLFFSIIVPLLLVSCATNTGTFGVGRPTALPPKQSMDSLKTYAKYLQTRMGIKPKDSEIEDLDPLKTNRTTRIEYAKALNVSIAASPGGPIPPTIPADGNSSLLPSITGVSIIEDSDKPSGLLMDKISTLEAFAAHKQRMFDLSCLYENSPDKLYKVFFTLWVEPERQDLWTYLWRWADIWHGFRNYTKDYHADIMFKIKDSGNATVVRLEPEHEGSISDEYYALMNQSQLGLSGAWQEIAAKGDLAERLRQAEVEQRKYPILRSVIESDNTNIHADFHYIVSPRQHVEERTFRIPLFMSPYAIKRRLESVPYNVSAYFLVPARENKLTIEVTACYKEYGKPERDCSGNMITKYHEAISEKDDKKYYKTISLNIDLPKTTKTKTPDNIPNDSEICKVYKDDSENKTPKPKKQTTSIKYTSTIKQPM